MKPLTKYYKCCEELRKEFVFTYFLGEEDWGNDDSYWIADRIGETLSVADMYFNLDKIVKILELEMTEDELYDWYWADLDFAMVGKTMPLNLENWVRVSREGGELPKVK